MLIGKSLLSTNDISNEELLDLMEYAQQIVKSPECFSHLAEGKILATLFFEPSTRTRLSFEAAMHRLGGSVIGFSETASSSTSKGESLQDTIRVVSGYVDIIAMRHPMEGAAVLADQVATVPLINAGDGGHQHPTQTLADVLTILETKGRLTDMKIGFCGDLKYGRTVHSLVKTMSRFEGNSFRLISPEELKLPSYIKRTVLEGAGIPFEETTDLEGSLEDLDILYMTRIQRERFPFEADYIRLKDSYVLDAKKLKNAKKDLAILHPLPRVNEIAVDVDKDPRAVYFDQTEYGMYARMALIATLLGVRK